MSRRVVAIAALVLLFAATAAMAVALWPDRDPSDGGDALATAASAGGELPEAGRGEGKARSSQRARADDLLPPGSIDRGGEPADGGEPVAAADTRFALRTLPLHPPVRIRLKRPPAGGVLFDVDSGEVLWERHATVPRPIASLTKLMTALLVSERADPGERVAVSPKAARTPGSATGVLPRGKRVPLEPLLQALIMISANDAAVALAEHHAGSVQAFIEQMNRRATLMGLSCTHFSTPNGLRDRGNHSCPLDVAALARADLADERIAAIAETRYAKPPFPIKGRRLHLANNHYFLQRGLRGVPGAQVTGLKTGFTDPAGRCYVTTARIGATHLGVVLLGSPDPPRQVPRLLHAGFVEAGALPAPAARRPAGPPPAR